MLNPINRRNRRKNRIAFVSGFVLSAFLALLAFCLWVIFWNVYPHTAIVKHLSPNSSLPAPCRKRIIGYYSGWEYREITDKQLSKLTHIIFAFVDINLTGKFAFRSEAKETLFRRMIEKAKIAGVKVMFSTGPNYLFEEAEMFSDAIVSFITAHKIDGIDLNFQWNNETSKLQNDALFLKDLRVKLTKAQMKQRRFEPFIISISLKSSKLKLEDEVYLDAITNYVDFVNVFSRDYFNFWKQDTGEFTGPPVSLHNLLPHNESIDGNMQYYSCATQRPNKLNLDVNFYGTYWSNETKSGYTAWRNIGMWKSTTPSWNKTFLSYNHVRKVYVFFENRETIKAKMDYISEKNIGGVTIWRIEFDDDQMTLLNSIDPICSEENGDFVNYNCDI